jgi:hypothetical protein
MFLVVTVAALFAGWIGYRLRFPALIEMDSAAFGNPDYVITVNELQRTGNASTVKVDRKKGFSVGSVMFVSKALYRIAKARGAGYFVNLKEWQEADGTRTMLVGFTSTKDADIKKEFGEQFSDTDEGGQKRCYIKVSDYDMLFAEEEPERQAPIARTGDQPIQ